MGLVYRETEGDGRGVVMDCSGSCEEHTWDVQQVHVWGNCHDWGEFWYCEEAIREDRRRGLTVEPVDE